MKNKARTMSGIMKRAIVVIVVVASLAMNSSGLAQDASIRLTQGKIAHELGDLEVAERHYAVAVGDGLATAELRIDALLLLAGVREQLGRQRAAVDALLEAVEVSAESADLRRRVVEAVAGVSPQPESWVGRWQQVGFQVVESDSAAPVLEAIWPGCGDGQGTWQGDPISIHLKDADIRDVLSVIQQLTGLEMDLDECVRARITADLTEVPWDAVLVRVLGVAGLECELVDGRLQVTCPHDFVPTPDAPEVEASPAEVLLMGEPDSDPKASIWVFLGTSSAAEGGACTAAPTEILRVPDIDKGMVESGLVNQLRLALDERLVLTSLGTVEFCGSAETTMQVAELVDVLQQIPTLHRVELANVIKTPEGLVRFRILAEVLTPR